MALHHIADVVLRHLKGLCVVEVGMGGTTSILSDLAKAYKRKLYSCDINIGKAKMYTTDYPRHIVFPGTSFDFIAQFDDTPAVVFLDGSHDYKIVSKEVDFFFERLTRWGVIFIHDTYPPTEEHAQLQVKCGDIWRLRQEWEQKRDICECFTWPFTASGCGLTMILKKDTDRPFYRE